MLWWIGLTIVGAWLLAKSRFGNWIYGAGGDPVAARNVGVPVARTKIALFMMTSGTAALMGIITALELRSIQAKEGIGLEFIFIICAVVGGCLLTGGYGSVIGTFFGAAMLGMVQLGIIFAQWDSNWTYTFQGAILFAAVMLNTVDPQPRAEERDERLEPHLLEADGISKYYGNVVALKDISALRERRRGDVHPRRQRRRQVELHQDPLGRPPARRRAAARRRRGGALRLAARRARAGHRDRLPGSRDGAADVDLAELLPRRRAAQGLRAARSGSTRRRRSGSCARS